MFKAKKEEQKLQTKKEQEEKKEIVIEDLKEAAKNNLGNYCLLFEYPRKLESVIGKDILIDKESSVRITSYA